MVMAIKQMDLHEPEKSGLFARVEANDTISDWIEVPKSGHPGLGLDAEGVIMQLSILEAMEPTGALTVEFEISTDVVVAYTRKPEEEEEEE
jgi:hypothetical protein